MTALLGLIAYLAAALAVLAMAGLVARAGLVLAHAHKLHQREQQVLQQARQAVDAYAAERGW